jgi:RNA polymerase sigma-70 factor (ECF subfamily)
MRRYNPRLYRVARAILANDADAEQVMQDAYVSAYSHLSQFADRAKFSTWLTKIAVHEALARVRKRKKFVDFETFAESSQGQGILVAKERNPEQQLMQQELKQVVEAAIEALPEHYRSVLVLRDVEGLDTAETSECLGISEEAVKTRLHRARGLARKELFARSGPALTETFAFHLSRCDRVVEAVFERIKALQSQGPPRERYSDIS